MIQLAEPRQGVEGIDGYVLAAIGAGQDDASRLLDFRRVRRIAQVQQKTDGPPTAEDTVIGLLAEHYPVVVLGGENSVDLGLDDLGIARAWIFEARISRMSTPVHV